MTEIKEVKIDDLYKKILDHLITKYTYQIIELYGREESSNDLEPILTNLGISSNVLDCV